MNSDRVLEEINENGIYIFPEPYLDPEEISKIRYLAAIEHAKNTNSDYQFGKAARIGNYQNWKGTAIYDLFSRDIVWQVSQGFFGQPPSFNEIFLTHDYINSNGLARNGWLHFDRIPTLKFFMYLTDCDENCGPFSYSPGSYKIGKKLREDSISQASGYEEIKNRLEVDFPDLGYTAKDATPVIGPAGTMFAFHTDLFHVGGLVQDENSREVIRIHIRQ